MKNFAALSYSTSNLGDDIQTLAALQFIPSVNAFVDRDRIAEFSHHREHHIILNGWFMARPVSWPPHESLNALLTSMHIARSELLAPGYVEYLRVKAKTCPVGARDLVSLARLREAKVESFHSGCLTLTLAIENVPARVGGICAVDLPKRVLRHLERRLGTNCISMTHRLHRLPRWFIKPLERLRRAESLLRTYLTSNLIVTGRLHAALPALALGTPVLFVTDDPGDPRFSGFLEHLHWVTTADFLNGRPEFDLREPPRNPEGWVSLANRLRESACQFTGSQLRPVDSTLRRLESDFLNAQQAKRLNPTKAG